MAPELQTPARYGQRSADPRPRASTAVTGQEKQTTAEAKQATSFGVNAGDATEMSAVRLPEDAALRLGSARFRQKGVSNSQVTYSHDGALLASIEEDTILLWDSATGERVRRLTPEFPESRTDWPINTEVVEIDFSPVSRELAARFGNNIIRIWNLSTGGLITCKLEAEPSAALRNRNTPDQQTHVRTAGRLARDGRESPTHAGLGFTNR